MNKKTSKFSTIDLPALLLSAVLFVGVLTVFRACAKTDEGMWMHCHYVELAIAAIGITSCLLTFINMTFIKKLGINTLIRIITIALAIISIMLPGRIVSMCMMETMRCHAVMKPFVTIDSAILIIFSVVAIVVSFLKERKTSLNTQMQQ